MDWNNRISELEEELKRLQFQQLIKTFGIESEITDGKLTRIACNMSKEE